MSKLEAFLNPTQTQITAEVIVGDRFKDSEGNDVPFVIKKLRSIEERRMRKACEKIKIDKKGNKTEEFDNERFSKLITINSIVEPNLQDPELLAAYKVDSPEDLLDVMFFLDEKIKLDRAITKLNGLGNLEEEAEEAKN